MTRFGGSFFMPKLISGEPGIIKDLKNGRFYVKNGY